MGLAEFDRIDIVAGADDGGERWISVAGYGWPLDDEARLIALFLIKMANLRRHASHQEKPVHLELVSADEPPSCVVEIAGRLGITATVGIEDRRPAQGRPSTFPNTPDGWPDIGVLMESNARAFAQRRELPLPPTIEALDEVDAALTERREEAEVGEDEESDDAIDGDLMVLAGAYAGEAIRAQVGGTWKYEPEPESMNPIHLAAGPNADIKVNVLGKALKFLRSGPSDSVASLAAAVVRMVRERGGSDMS
jgi:hypothetical protein